MINEGNKYFVAGVTRPLLSLISSRKKLTGQPSGRSHLWRWKGSTAVAFRGSAWLKAYGIENLVAISADRLGGAEYPLLFAVRDRHLLHLGSLLWFEAACIEYLTEVLLEQPGVDFVVFEDVQVEGPLRSASAARRSITGATGRSS